MLPMFRSHPPGWHNPVVLRAYAALPAAGAWDATPTESFASGADHMTLSFTYAEGAQTGTGAFDWQLEISIYAVVGNVPTSAAEWVTESLYAAGAVVAGADTGSNVQREYQTYTITAAGATEDFVYGPIPLNGTIERVRVRARESGNAGTPGSLSIVAELF